MSNGIQGWAGLLAWARASWRAGVMVWLLACVGQSHAAEPPYTWEPFGYALEYDMGDVDRGVWPGPTTFSSAAPEVCGAARDWSGRLTTTCPFATRTFITRPARATAILPCKTSPRPLFSIAMNSTATNCGGDMFNPYVVFSQLSGKIEAMTANTRERAKRYMEYNAASSGSSTTLPNGNTCEP